MAKKKVQASCVDCKTIEGLYVTIKFADGEKKLPSYTVVIGKGIVCYPCYEKAKVTA